jgi:hypothetical protein
MSEAPPPFAAYAALKKRIRELEAALRKYGAHEADCGDARACMCGLDAAIAGSQSDPR